MKPRKYLPLLALVLGLLLVAAPVQAATLPPLGTAASFGVLAGSTVTNTGPTHVVGDVGVSPGAAVTGFPPGTLTGALHAGDAVALQAQQDVTIAYNNAAGQACDQNLTGQDLGGLTLTAGVYCFTSSAQLTGRLTLDGQGNPNSVFIFKIGSTLITASNANVLLINGAQPCRIFWQVGSSATLGTTTNFSGNILALASITLNTGAVSNGGLYARTGAVTLDSNQIQSCGAATPTATNTPPASTATATSGPPTATLAPSTGTPVLPTSTVAPPTTTPVNTPVPATRPPRATAPPSTETPVNTPAPPTTPPLSTPVTTPGPGATETALPADTATATAAATETALPADTATAIAAATSTAQATETSQPAATATAIAATATGQATETPIAAATATAQATATAAAGASATAVTGGSVGGMPRTGASFDGIPWALALIVLLLGLGFALRGRVPHRAR